MKKYAVGINTGTHSIALIAYNEKFVPWTYSSIITFSSPAKKQSSIKDLAIVSVGHTITLLGLWVSVFITTGMREFFT